MKNAVRYLFSLLLLTSIVNQSKAQCSASEILISNVVQASSQTPGTCAVTFDLSFQMEDNGGNKYIFVHAWLNSLYPDFFHCVNGSPDGNGALHPPMASDLAATFLNIGIDNSGATPVILPTYTPDPSLTLTTVTSITRTTLPDGSGFFILHGVSATFPAPCDSAFVIAFDFWSSQSAQAQVVHCVNCNVLYPLNYLSIGGFGNCSNQMYNVVLTNRSDTILNGFVKIYSDVNGDGFLAPGVDVLITDTTNFSIAAGPGTTTNIVGSIPLAYSSFNLLVWAKITSDGGAGAAQVKLILTAACSPLPVTFMSFTAIRTNRTSVLLKWETATEINNSGFYIERNLANDVWETIGFVPSQAVNGNSTSQLNYNYTDANNPNKGITQYRLMQVDINGSGKYSQIRAVRGEGQKGVTIIYPNPSTTGTVNVVFDLTNTTRDVFLFDMTGRLLKQWKNLSGNTLRIDNLGTGVYNLKISNIGNGESSVERFVVQ